MHCITSPDLDHNSIETHKYLLYKLWYKKKPYLVRSDIIIKSLLTRPHDYCRPRVIQSSWSVESVGSPWEEEGLSNSETAFVISSMSCSRDNLWSPSCTIFRDTGHCNLPNVQSNRCWWYKGQSNRCWWYKGQSRLQFCKLLGKVSVSHEM